MIFIGRPMQARDQQRRCVSLIDAKQASRRELGEFTRVANAELPGPRLRSILGLKPLAAVDGPERSCPNSAPRPTRCGLQLSTHAHALDTSVSRTVGRPLKYGTYTPFSSRRDRCRRGPSRSKKIAARAERLARQRSARATATFERYKLLSAGTFNRVLTRLSKPAVTPGVNGVVAPVPLSRFDTPHTKFPSKLPAPGTAVMSRTIG